MTFNHPRTLVSDMTPIIRRGIPISAAREIDELVLAISDAPGLSFSEPFFEQTVRAAGLVPLANSVSFKRWRLVSVLGDAPVHLPAGIVFHMSRCGSTLLAQMLKSNDHSLVFSEPM